MLPAAALLELLHDVAVAVEGESEEQRITDAFNFFKKTRPFNFRGEGRWRGGCDPPGHSKGRRCSLKACLLDGKIGVLFVPLLKIGVWSITE